MLKVNKDKCIKCYKCIQVCPFTVLEKKTDGIPGLNEKKNCLECMHCGAICPVDAFSNDGKKTISDDDVSKLPESFKGELKDHIRTRRSYRHFIDKPVDKDLLNDILDVVRWTPSAKNQHPTKYIVVNSKDTIEQMMSIILEHVKESGISPEVVSEYETGNNVVMGNAPTLLIAYATDDAVNSVGDTYISMTTAELLLQSHGIGTCWAGYLTRFLNGIPMLKAMFDLPEGHSFYASFMMGYPDGEHYDKIPARVFENHIRWID